MHYKQLRKMALAEIEDLRGRAGDSQRGHDCLQMAERLVRKAEQVRAERWQLGSVELLSAVVICRAALDGVDMDVPFCWLNPLHGRATAHGVFDVGLPPRKEPRPLCANCAHHAAAKPDQAGTWVLSLQGLERLNPYFANYYFRLEGGGLDVLLKDADLAMRRR